MDFSDVSRLMDYRTHFDGMDSDLSPNSRDSNETSSSSPRSVTLSPSLFHELGIAVDLHSFASSEPQLCIVEQPVEKFRFRYRSETTGVHGAITGRKRGKTFPSVQLHNYDRPAHIRCSLFTAQSDPSQRTPSCHQLVVKGTKDNNGTLSIPVNQGGTGDTACFAGMAIINTANKDKLDELRSKLQARKLEEKERSPGTRGRLTIKETADIEEEATRLSKDPSSKDTVTLCFECFNEEMQPICCPVFSGVISNQKSAMTNELKITRIDKHASSCRGKEEVFMLVEKVNKKHIMVKFFELDDDGETVVWSDFGTFTQLDVHHQYAIVFKTPPYRRLDIEESVEVFIELYRPTDGATSTPIKFQYKPCENQGSRRKKRRRESALETQRIDDPMLFNGEAMAALDDNFVSNTESIEAVFTAPLLPLEDIGNLIDTNFTDFTWVDSDVVLDSAAARKEPASTLKPVIVKTEKVDADDTEEQKSDNALLNRVVKGCAEANKRRTDATDDIVDAFLKLCTLQTDDGNTALHIAVDNEDLPTLTSLVKEIAACRCPAVLDVANDNHQTALHLSVSTNQPAMVESLVGGGASLSPTNSKGRTAMHLAVELGHDACLDALAGGTSTGSRDALEERDQNGLTALHLAVVRGNLRAVRRLCAMGAKPNTGGRNGETALHVACQEGHVGIARFLVDEALADVDVEDISGNTAMDVASAKGCRELVQLLAKAGGRASRAADSESDSEEFEDAESGSETDGAAVENSGADSETDSFSSLPERSLLRLYDFLDQRERWKPLAEALDFGFLIGGIDAETVGSPGKTLVNFADVNGVGVGVLRKMLTKMTDVEKVSAIFDS